MENDENKNTLNSLTSLTTNSHEIINYYSNLCNQNIIRPIPLKDGKIYISTNTPLTTKSKKRK